MITSYEVHPSGTVGAVEESQAKPSAHGEPVSCLLRAEG